MQEAENKKTKTKTKNPKPLNIFREYETWKLKPRYEK